MFGSPHPMYPNQQWNFHRPPHNPQWGHAGGNFRGRPQRFHQHRPPFQSGIDNYWCETCDRGFVTQDILNKHKQQHEKCNIDGCQFVAHPKVITKHIQMQHSTGLYKKIANLQKPEDIEKWREERRKKYPTKTNIDKKVAELKEKIDRGEKMGLDRNKDRFNKDSLGYNKDNSRYNRDSRTGQGVKRRNNTRHENEPKSKFVRNNSTDSTHSKKPPPRPTPKPLPAVEENRKLRPFTGISCLEIDSDNEVEDVKDTSDLTNLIEDDDFEVPKNIEIKSVEISEPIVCGALSSLMCEYGSTDEEDNNEVFSSLPKQEKPQNMLNGYKSAKTLIPESNIEKNGITKEVKHNLEVENFKENISRNMKQEPSQNMCHKNNNVNVPIKKPNDQKSEEILTKEISQKTSLNNKDIIMNNNVLTPQSSNQDNENFRPHHMTNSIEPVCKADLHKEINPVQNTVQGQNENDDNDSGPEEIKVDKNLDVMTLAAPECSKPNIVRKKTITVHKQYRRPKPKLPSTLLHKLLYKEMQQERNIVLQCIRYVKNNNYFDKNE